MTHIEQRRQQAQQNMQHLLKVLGWREEQYCQYIYNSGISYLGYLLPHDALGLSAMESSRMFWNWWSNAWANRDTVFLEVFGDETDVEDLYLNEHDPRTLAAAIYPTGVVMRESCRHIINSLKNILV